tara:strand:+ start:3689 stop:4831 length:1143 start_codon:yes stop_codon:yes gene_type:complete
MFQKSLLSLFALCLASCGFFDGAGPSAKQLREVSGLPPGQVGNRMQKLEQRKAASVNGAISGHHDEGVDYIPIHTARDLPKPRLEALKVASLPPAYGMTYRHEIAPEDQLLITIHDTTERSPFYSVRNDGPQGIRFGPFEVLEDGVIKIPYLAEINVLDWSVGELVRELNQRIDQISTTAEVEVTRVARRPLQIMVMGAVASPGPVEINRKGFTVLDALGSAGGVDEEHLVTYRLLRGGKSYATNLEQLTRSAALAQDGDVLHVIENEGFAVQVMGAKTSGRFAFADDKPTLMDALAQAGGLGRGNAHGVFVFRLAPDGRVKIHGIDLVKNNGIPLAQHFILEPEDVVYVSESGIAKWQRAMTVVLPLLGVASVAERISD